MSANWLIVAFDTLGLAGFAAAMVAVLLLPVKGSAGASRGVKVILAIAFALYAFVGVSNVLEHAGITPALDVYEDYSEIMMMPLMAYAVYSARLSESLGESRRALRMLEREHAMLMNVLNTSPAGLVVLDDICRVTFANKPAREMLSLTEDTETGRFVMPKDLLWHAADDPDSFAQALFSQRCLQHQSGVMMVVTGPGTARRVFSFSCTPMADKTGHAGGAVVAFEDVTERELARGA